VIWPKLFRRIVPYLAAGFPDFDPSAGAMTGSSYHTRAGEGTAGQPRIAPVSKRFSTRVWTNDARMPKHAVKR
jgi:hypothetical protein